jgi:hypothetical protein
LEASTREEKRDFFDLFKHLADGEHCGSWIGYRGSTFTQADKWAPIWWGWLEECLASYNLPKSFLKAMRNDCIHKWARIMTDDDVEFVRAIKDMASDDDLNPDDEDACLEVKARMAGSIVCQTPGCSEIAKLEFKRDTEETKYLCDRCGTKEWLSK